MFLSTAETEGGDGVIPREQRFARDDIRRAHVGASADLAIVADEIVQVVRVMDALNQIRFADDGELLPAWKSAANIVTPKPGSATDLPAGDVPPAGEVTQAA